MNLEKEFWDTNGLLNSKVNEKFAENSPLWTLEYILLKLDLNDKVNKELLDMRVFLAECATNTVGLYNQVIQAKDNVKDLHTSPDQLVSFIGLLKLRNEKTALREIWTYLVRHMGTYDNLSGRLNFKRMMQPIALVMAAVAGSRLSILFRPVLALILLQACWVKPEATSGKLKAWVVSKSLNMKFTMYIMTRIIKRNKFKTWSEVFGEYFPVEGHPIRRLLGLV